jgi:hypothetical protein
MSENLLDDLGLVELDLPANRQVNAMIFISAPHLGQRMGPDSNRQTRPERTAYEPPTADGSRPGRSRKVSGHDEDVEPEQWKPFMVPQPGYGICFTRQNRGWTCLGAVTPTKALSNLRSCKAGKH